MRSRPQATASRSSARRGLRRRRARQATRAPTRPASTWFLDDATAGWPGGSSMSGWIGSRPRLFWSNTCPPDWPSRGEYSMEPVAPQALAAMGNDVRLVFHEPYFEFTWRPIRQNALALAERLMATTLLRAASRVYLSTDAWRRYLRRICRRTGQELHHDTVPSAIPRCDGLLTSRIAAGSCWGL